MRSGSRRQSTGGCRSAQQTSSGLFDNDEDAPISGRWDITLVTTPPANNP
jgi:hypothetical protein